MGNESSTTTSGVEAPTGSRTGAGAAPGKHYTFKVVIVGEKGVGKTALLSRMVHGVYTGKEKPTQGVEFALLHLNNFTSSVGGDPTAVRRDDIRLTLWDIGGEEKFSGKTRFYYQHAVAAIVVADASKPKSLVAAEGWIRDLRAKANIKGPNGEALSLPIILFLTKADLVPPKQISALTPAVKELVRSNELLGFWTCSAKEEVNLSRPISTLISKLLEQRHSDEIKMERSEGYSWKNWQPDELATNCAACQTEFSMFTWKHHCRACGLIYCNSCTPHMLTLRDKGHTTPVKVCVNCHASMLAEAKKKESTSPVSASSSSSVSSLSSSSSSSTRTRTTARTGTRPTK